jgi:hypothetical protein
VQVVQLSLDSLGGRPRDVCSCTISNYARESIANEDMRAVLEDVNSVLTVTTSNGCVCVLCVNSLETLKQLDQSTIVSTNIKVEPRLIAGVCWNRARSHATKHGSVDNSAAVFNPESYDKSTQPRAAEDDNDDDSGSDSDDNGGSKKRKQKQESNKKQKHEFKQQTNNAKGKHGKSRDSEAQMPHKKQKKVSFSNKKH